MSKFFAVVLSVLLLVVTAVPLLATEARQMALAGTGNYIEDDYNIFTWYATLPSYTNTVWIGLNYGHDSVSAMGPTKNWAMGASYGLGKEGKYGTLAMFYYDHAPGLNPSGSPWPGSDVFTQSLGNKWTVIYAYPMEKMSLGLYFNRSDNAFKYENETEVTEEHKIAYTTLGAGVRFDLGDKAYTDLAFDYNMASFTDRNSDFSGYGEVSQDANAMIDVRGRMFYQWSETVTLVPYVAFGTYDFSLKADSALDWKDSYFGNKGMMFKIGVGANVKINENNLLIFAVEPYDYYRTEPSDPPTGITYKETKTYMPTFYLALESDVKDWLTLRAGCHKDFYKSQTKLTTEADHTSETNTSIGSDFDFFMGLGFHVGDFDIDALVNPDLPFKVGYWLTGYSEWNNYEDVPIYRISTTYHF